MPIITAARVIFTCPGRNLVTLKIETDEGVYGLGDATLNGRELAVVSYLKDHVWTPSSAQELLCNDEHRSGASMCSACSRSTASLLALMKSEGRLPNHVIALEAL